MLADRPLDPRELQEIDLRATEFMKFLKTEELQQKRITLQVEIFKIDCELENVAKGIFSHYSREEVSEKFDRLVAMAKEKAEK